MADLMDVFVKIGADTSGLESGIGKAEGTVSKFASGVGKVAKIGVGAFAAVGSAVAGSSAAFVSAAGDIAEYGDNIDKMSQKMGISAQGYQEWEAVMQHSGTSMETMKSSMKTLANAVEKGNDSFERIGISIEDLGNMSNEEIFNATIAGLQNVENETERTYLAGQLLGKGATELGALLNTSAEDTQAMKDRVHELGGVMSDDAVKAAAKYQDSLQDMQTAFGGLKRNLISEFLPSITTVMDGLTNLFSGDSQGLGQIKEGIKGFVDNLTQAIPEVLKTGAEIVKSLISAIMENAPQLISAGVETIGILAQGLLENGSVITDAIYSLMEMALKGLQEFDFASAAESVMNFFANAFSGDGIGKFIEIGTEILKTLVNGIIEAVPAYVEGFSNIMGQMGEAIKTGLPQLVSIGLDVVKGLSEAFMENAPTLLQSGIDLIMALADGLLEALPSLVEAVPQIIANLLSTIISAAPQLIAGGVELIVKLTTGIVQAIPALIAEFPKMIGQIVDAFNNVDWAGLGSHLIQTIVDGVKSLYEALPQIMKAIAEAVVKIVKDVKWAELGKNVIKFIGNGIKTLINELPNLFKTICNSVLKTITSINWLGVGADIVSGIVKGVLSMASALINVMVDLAKSAWTAVKAFFGIASPSKLMRDTIGKNIALGMIEGITNETSDVENAMQKLANSATDISIPRMTSAVETHGFSSDDAHNGITTSASQVLSLVNSEQDASRDITIILELDREQFARAVYKYNLEETQRVGLTLVGGLA